MIMNRLANILRLISEFADEDFQRRSWFGIGPEVSSPDEMCNQIDDLLLHEWIEKNSLSMSQNLREYLNNFLISAERLPESQSPLESFSSLDWCLIRSKASVLRDLLIKEFEVPLESVLRTNNPHSRMPIKR